VTGRKVFTLQTLPPVDIDEMHTGIVEQVAGFNLHAGVAARADERQKPAGVKSAESQNSSTFCFSVKVFFWPIRVLAYVFVPHDFNPTNC
jgi:hypothetical protein